MAYTFLFRSFKGVKCVLERQKLMLSNVNGINLVVACVQRNPVYVPHRIAAEYFSTELNNTDRTGQKRTKGPKISLLGTDQNVTVMFFEEAEKLAKRRDLKLVKVTDLDTNSQRPLYKLMTGAEYFEEDLKQRKIKSQKTADVRKEKVLTMSAKMSEHDLQSRLKNIKKWMEKNHEANILITSDGCDEEVLEHIFKTMQDSVKEHGQLVQKQKKGSNLKFRILPRKKKEEPSSESYEKSET